MLRLQLSYLNSHVLFAGFLLLGVASSIRAEPGVTPAETRGGEDLAAVASVCQASRQVHRVAHDGVREPIRRADDTGEEWAGVDTDAHVER